MPTNLLTDLEIRNSIIDTIRPATDDALLLNRWVLGLGLGESIPYMSVPLTGKIHGYMVSRSSIKREKTKIGSQQFYDVWSYRLWGFYGFRVGNNAGNSEDEFNQEIDNLQTLFASKPYLNLDYTETNIVEHRDWQIQDIDVFEFGNEGRVHIAQGTLDVVLRVQA